MFKNPDKPDKYEEREKCGTFLPSTESNDYKLREVGWTGIRTTEFENRFYRNAVFSTSYIWHPGSLVVSHWTDICLRNHPKCRQHGPGRSFVFDLHRLRPTRNLPHGVRLYDGETRQFRNHPKNDVRRKRIEINDRLLTCRVARPKYPPQRSRQRQCLVVVQDEDLANFSFVPTVLGSTHFV